MTTFRMQQRNEAYMKMKPYRAPFISMPDGTLVYRTELIAAYERIKELEDLARNLAGLDENWLLTADLNLLRATIREWRDEARALLSDEVKS